MSEASSPSNLSATSSRSEHMNYLMTELSLDKPAAMLMYRAERLQDKGQLQQALRYFERVLSTNPDCDEAVVNARMIREQLSDQSASLPTIGEDVISTPAPVAQAPTAWQTVEMQITEEFHDKEQWDCYWSEGSMNDAMLRIARKQLKEHNISTPFVTLVSNVIETYTPPVYDDPWMDNMYTCRATVRVTFSPNANAPQRSASIAPSTGNAEAAAMLAQLFADMGSGQAQENMSRNSTQEPESESGYLSGSSHGQSVRIANDSAVAACSAVNAPAEAEPSVNAASCAEVGASLRALHLLEYSRTPECFHRALNECEELVECMEKLNANGYATQLDGGLKIFVQPELYTIAVAAVKSNGEDKLQSRHIVASDQFVEIVRGALAKIPSKHQVKVKNASPLNQLEQSIQHDTGAAAAVVVEAGHADEFPVEIKHTFLHVQVPNSVYSDADSTVTARTAPAAFGA